MLFVVNDGANEMLAL